MINVRKDDIIMIISYVVIRHHLRFQLLKENLRLSMCINRIVKHIKEKYKYDLSPDEQTFLCIHIKRIMQ